MWWIIFTPLVIFILFVVVILIITSIHHNRGDYGDGGGTQVGGEEHIRIFAPRNDRAGIWGEKVVNYYLRPLLREDEYLLANVLLPLKNGHKTEIDCILISRKGIFCVETKAWVGHISGNDEDEYWVQQYDDPYMDDRMHKNPIKQNEGHCAVLKRKLHNNYEVDNVVIFADLEDGCGIYSDYAYTVNGFRKYYRGLNDDELTPVQIKAVYQMLLPFVSTVEELERHREDVKRKYN